MEDLTRKLFSEVSKCTVSICKPDGAVIGTGFYFSDEARVLTAKHVIEGFSDVRIVRFDETQQETMNVVYLAGDHDGAILQGIRKPDVYLNASPSFQSGDTGFIFGCDYEGILKLSSGVISERAKSVAFGANQDCYIVGHVDSCYSGGPITDRKGQVTGMTLGGKGICVVSTRMAPIHALHFVVQAFYSSISRDQEPMAP